MSFQVSDVLEVKVILVDTPQTLGPVPSTANCQVPIIGFEGVDLQPVAEGRAESRKKKIAPAISRRVANGRDEPGSFNRFKKVPPVFDEDFSTEVSPRTVAGVLMEGKKNRFCWRRIESVSRGRPKAKALGYEPLVSRWPVMPGLKSGPISEAKATTERVYSVGVAGRPGRGRVRVTGQTPESEIDPTDAR